MKQLLVTTGATVTFEKLIRFTLDPRYIGTLEMLGYTDLVVQYGKSDEAKQLLDSLLKKLSDTPVDITGQLTYEKVKVHWTPFDKDLTGKYTKNSFMVVSHAGTGSIMDTLRLGKKLIVMINDSLKDNHQVDIGKAFEELNVLKVANGSFGQFLALMKEADTYMFDSLPTPNGAAIEQVIIE